MQAILWAAVISIIVIMIAVLSVITVITVRDALKPYDTGRRIGPPPA